MKNVSETASSKLLYRPQLLTFAIKKMEFEQATLQFQAVYVKDNHQ